MNGKEHPDSLTLPGVWGDGILFSGLTHGISSGNRESEVNAANRISSEINHNPLLFLTGSEPFSFFLLQNQSIKLHIACRQPVKTLSITSDTFQLECENSSVVMTFCNENTLVGQHKGNVSISLQVGNVPFEGELGKYCFIRTEEKFILACGSEPGQAREKATAGLRENIDRIVYQRHLLFYHNPINPPLQHAELYHKCLSLLQTPWIPAPNTLPCPWAHPHYKNNHNSSWIWEQTIQSLGMDLYHTPSAEKTIREIFSRQQKDGMIPHCLYNHECISTFTHPPILAWMIWKNFDLGENPAKLRQLYPLLEKSLLWNLKNRDINGNGLLEWSLRPQPFCMSGESGMETSPRFDSRKPADNVDFSVLQARDMHFASLIASEIKLKEQSTFWATKAQEMSDSIHRYLWDEDTRFYYDRFFDRQFQQTRSITGLFPLLLPDVPEKRLEGLVEKIENDRWFKTENPLPTVAVSDPDWSLQINRGATWLHTNFLIIQGLRQHGFQDHSDRLKNYSIQMVTRCYRNTANIQAFFDPQGEAIVEMPRDQCFSQENLKKPDNNGLYQKDSIWAAALTLCLIMA